MQRLRSSFADGNLNAADDWPDWNDYLIFREEQRAIGETLIDTEKKSVVGYGDFRDRLLSEEPDQSNRWIGIALLFLADLESVPRDGNRDFRRARCLLIIKHGISLIECLNKERLSAYLRDSRDRAEMELQNYNVNLNTMVRL
jgi:hypothetical protein